MEIFSIESFLSYHGKTRLITSRVVAVIPPEELDWSYQKGKFSIGDLVRHMAAIERYVFAEVATGNKPRYRGCGKELADGYTRVKSFFNELHAESMAMFQSIPDDALSNRVKSLDGKSIELRNFLRALSVHEIHHRAALCIYLNMLGVKTPPVIGLTEQQVIDISTSGYYHEKPDSDE